MKSGFNPFGIICILNYINKNKIRLVHSHGYKTNIFLELIPKRKFKLISTVHGWSKGSAGLKIKIIELLDSLLMMRKDAVIAVSHAVASDLQNIGLDIKKIALIYNGIKLNIEKEIPNQQQMRQKYGISSSEFVIGSVGRLSKIKGHSILIEAMPKILKEVEHCKVIIAGDGPLRPDLEALIERLGLTDKIKLIGFTDDISGFLSLIDLFVLLLYQKACLYLCLKRWPKINQS